MRKLIMYVYGDITTDARVNRAATSLSNVFDVTLISTEYHKPVDDTIYRNRLVGSPSTGMKSLFLSIHSAYRIIREEKPDVVYCHDYYSSILALLLIVTGFHGKIVYDAHELIIPESGKTDRRLSFFGWFEKSIVKKVNLVICASTERARLMKDYYGLDESPLVIRNISQLSIIDDEATKEVLRSLESFFNDDRPTIVYAGVVTRSRRIGELLHVASSLAPKYKLLIVGDGDARAELAQESATCPNLKIAFTGSIPYKSLGSVLSKCDIGFIYYPVDTLNNIYCASNKIYEYSSVGLPMVSNDNPTVRKEMITSGIGIASDDFSAAIESIAGKLVEYKKNCCEYTDNNPWSSEAVLLNEMVGAL